MILFEYSKVGNYFAPDYLSVGIPPELPTFGWAIVVNTDIKTEEVWRLTPNGPQSTGAERCEYQ